jgi:hypothetical protein
VAKCRNTIASETLAASAISLVVVPRKPFFEKRLTATARIWSRRSSPAIRALTVPSLVICLPKTGLSLSSHAKVSTYLPPRGLDVKHSLECGGPAPLCYRAEVRLGFPLPAPRAEKAAPGRRTPRCFCISAELYGSVPVSRPLYPFATSLRAKCEAFAGYLSAQILLDSA